MKTIKKLFLLCLFCMISIGASAYDFSAKNANEVTIYYNITTDSTCAVTYRTTDYNSYSGVVSIPTSVTHDSKAYHVTSIVGEAFYKCSDLTAIKIPNSVTSIEPAAFASCTSLTSIFVAGGNTVYDSRSGCNAIIETSTNTLIAGCKNTIIPISVTSIGEWAFYGCTGLTAIEIPDFVTSIGKRAFYNCIGLKSVTIPNSVTSIGKEAFEGCTGLTLVTIPNSVTSIDDEAFAGCTSLTTINIPNTVTSIGGGAFAGCTSLPVENNLRYADTYLVEAVGDKTLSTYTIKEGTKWIGTSAFYCCGGLTSITIPNSVTSIGTGAFEGCTGLTSVTIPNSVTSIEPDVFMNCIGLKSVIIGNAVMRIGFEAFAGCTGLKSIEIPNSVTSIGECAFRNCENLASVKIPNSVTSIGEIAFDGCIRLATVTNLATTPQKISSNTFSEYVMLHVIQGYGDVYENADNWNKFMIVDDIPPILVSSIAIDQDTYYCTLGEKCKATATVKPDDATNKTVVWSSSNEEKLTIDANTGEFTGLALGNVTITATSTDGSNISDTCTVTVTAAIVPATSITLSKEVASIEAGKTLTLTATILPENATVTDLDWTSSNPTVATVDNGVVSGLTEGKTTITATSTDGTNISATCEVTVIEQGSIEPSTDISKYPNIIYFNDIETRAGSELTLPLNMKNAEENITAFQCDVYLPAGMSWASTIDKRGNIVLTQPTFDAETERTDENYHVISPVTQMPDGSYRIIVYSMSMDYILDKDGAILDLPIVVAEDMEAGEYNMFLRNVVMTDVDGQQVLLSEVVSKVTVPSFTPGDVNDDKMINVTDVVAVISHMLGGSPSPFIFKAADVNNDNMINVTDVVGIIKIINTGSSSTVKTIKNIAMVGAKSTPTDKFSLVIEPFTVASGTTSKSVSLNMNNPSEDITAFECNIHLPEGISWSSTVDRRGNITYDLPTFNATADRTDSRYHTIAPITKMEDGSFKVVVYSMGLEIFLDKSGAILDLPLVFDENLADGIYDITMSDIVLTHTDVTDIHLDEYKLSVLVGSPKEKVLTLHGDFTRQSVTDYNSALAANTDVTTMDLTEAFDIDATATFATANKNLLLYVAEGKSVANKENVIVGNKAAKLTLTDGHSFYAPKAFTAESGSYVRKNITTLCSVCLPFELTASDVNGNKIGVLYTNCIDANNGSITFEEVSKVSAGTPCIVNCANKTDWTIDLTNREIISDCDNTTAIKGSYDKHTIGEGFLKVDNEGTGFIHTGSESAVFPFRAYLDVEDADKLSVVRFTWVDGGATYIDSINMDTLNDKDVIFDLSGRRVARPMKRMVYLVNGKKVLIK